MVQFSQSGVEYHIKKQYVVSNASRWLISILTIATDVV